MPCGAMALTLKLVSQRMAVAGPQLGVQEVSVCSAVT